MGREHPYLGARGTTPVIPDCRVLREGGEVQLLGGSSMLFEGRPLGVTLGKGLAATKFAGTKRRRVGLVGSQKVGAVSEAAPIAIARPCPKRVLEADVVVQAFYRRLHGVEPEHKSQRRVPRKNGNAAKRNWGWAGTTRSRTSLSLQASCALRSVVCSHRRINRRVARAPGSNERRPALGGRKPGLKNTRW